MKFHGILYYIKTCTILLVEFYRSASVAKIEGFYYGISAVVISVILSTLLANTVIANIVSTSWVASYQFSLLPFVGIAPFILLLAYQIPMICYRGTQNKSLVERLRETTN